MSKRASAVESVPHSWRLRDWPETVFPNSTAAAKWLVREHRSALILDGALVRVGRELVVMGARYARWLEKHASRVPDYTIAPNRVRGRAAGNVLA